MKLSLSILIIALMAMSATAQTAMIEGTLKDASGPIPFAAVVIEGSDLGTSTDEDGSFEFKKLEAGNYTLICSALGYDRLEKKFSLKAGESRSFSLRMNRSALEMEEMVVSATLKEISKLESAVPVEVYSPKFFKANPSPSVYEAMSNVNGVRPQINCSVCNTGDIHINGLEGAYTMVLIDGMPIVSGLSTVYGLFGIPQQLIERVEIVKGPASTLYGSEAVGGLINVITKKPNNASLFSIDAFGTSWGEVKVDASAKFKLGDRVESLLGINYFNYSNPMDKNGDNFTDITLQDRISVFNKWSFQRKDSRLFSLAARYVYEDRWGGEMQWTPEDRGGTEIYGESIYTNRWEIFGAYELPTNEELMLSFSANGHYQNSVYGDMWYIGEQNIGFSQLTWNKRIGSRNKFMAGAALRYTYYDDNTPITEIQEGSNLTNNPSEIILPGVFLQDEFSLNENHKLLLGMRFDHNSIHGEIFSPRLNYKWQTPNKKNTFRLSFGIGYRVANVFTEDHAALTGAREVVFMDELLPERSWNSNLNYVRTLYNNNGLIFQIDASLFYTYFNNRIFADYDADPNKVIYDNLNGYAVSQGASMNIDLSYHSLSLLAGFTAMDVHTINNGIKERQELTERFTGTWNLGYDFSKIKLSVNYTGNLHGPMRLPLLSELDPRPEYSPWWSIQNIQLTKGIKKNIEVYGGVKNLLNWTPSDATPFLIARANDPFDQNVNFDTEGQALASPNNPYALTFDPAYVFAPQQGIRGFIGFRYLFD